jgi:HPr kinase/phosphorylase
MTTTTSNGGGVLLSALMHEFNLEVLYASDDIEKIVIASDDINRPGLQLAGFFDHFDAGNLQIIGRTEETFLERFTQERRRAAFENLFKRKIPALIFSRNMEPFPECLEIARKYDVTVLRSPEWTSTLMGDMLSTLRVWLAPRITRHGVLVEVYGEGILILGDSGIGKSETAIELVKRGHRLIADDAVEISKVSNHTLVGTAPEVIRHYIELRGIGVIDVRRIFGVGAVKATQGIDLVVQLELWREGKNYDRFGMEQQTIEIMDISRPLLTIPVKPGRNLAVIFEVAAMNNRDRKMGFNPASELAQRMQDAYDQ